MSSMNEQSQKSIRDNDEVERAPSKRRVKFVPKHLQQVDFDLDDSDEDSVFDIKQQLGSDIVGDDLALVSRTAPHHTPSDYPDQRQRFVQEKDSSGLASGSDSLTGADSDSDSSNDNDESDDEGDGENERGDISDDVSDSQHAINDAGLARLIGNDHLSDEDDVEYVPEKRRKKKKDDSLHKSSISKSPADAWTKRKDVTSASVPAVVMESATEDGRHGLVGQIRVVICCVCLSDGSAVQNEIVECDNCGVCVHEGCYGIGDSQSEASTVSSSSTEPWFCEACRAGVVPRCELCPSSCGVYKQTDTGRWVHLVCALYTPGVAFGDVDRLSPVTLLEMPYSKWGAKECSLCEDAAYSRTGVCVCCDAGMCRTHFHVTCAQREGLLSEAESREDIADPFFAHCKQHVDKSAMRVRRRNWLAIQSCMRLYTPLLSGDRNKQIKIERKLRQHRENYSIACARRPPAWVPSQKMVRHFHTSPHAVRAFLHKAALNGFVAQEEPSSTGDRVQAKHTTPAFASEFIQYYIGRNRKMDQLYDALHDLTAQERLLTDREGPLRDRYDQNFDTFFDCFWPKEFSLAEMRPPPSLPLLLQQCDVCRQTDGQHLLVRCDSCDSRFHLGCLSPPLLRMPRKSKMIGWQCSQCVIKDASPSDTEMESTDQPRRLRQFVREPIKFQYLQMSPHSRTRRAADQATDVWGSQSAARPCTVCHQSRGSSKTVQCDRCFLTYHLECLNPPVKRSPKVRGYVWSCASCDAVVPTTSDLPPAD